MGNCEPFRTFSYKGKTRDTHTITFVYPIALQGLIEEPDLEFSFVNAEKVLSLLIVY